MEQVYRLHYRGELKEDYRDEELKEALDCCVERIRQAQQQGKVLTAALYRKGRMLFFYYEAVGEPLAVEEPWKLHHRQKDAAPTQSQVKQNAGGLQSPGEPQLLEESGEDIQATVPSPGKLLEPLTPWLQLWPGQKEERMWVYMYHIYYHSIPKDAADWKRSCAPQLRRGRIAFLRSEKLFSYTYFHKAIVDEGLLKGDRYQSIALHENILFSYFEEPKTETNVKEQPGAESKVIEDWLAVDPESHFIHHGEGNFIFIPALFALGVE